nr:ComF family protein [uncultured Psychrobacter sp.]
MRALAPYQSGLWLAEYLSIRCQLCRIYRSSSQHHLTNNIPNLKKASKRLGRGLLCTHCHHSITWLPNPFLVDIAPNITLPIQAATYYDYPIREAISAFKHHEDITKLPLLVHALRQLPRPHGCHHSNSVIVAMPTTNPRLIKRGFDPVSILSTQLSKHWNIPLWHGVERIDDTSTQQGLTRAERLSNLDNAFAMTQSPPVKRLILFDDVATTGASLQALGRTCYQQVSMLHTSTSTLSSSNEISAYALAHGSQ